MVFSLLEPMLILHSWGQVAKAADKGIVQTYFWRAWPRSDNRHHQKQHYVPYYLSIVLILSIKYAFGIISMFFTLVRCSIVLLMFLLTYCIHVSYLMSKFIAFLNTFSCPTRNVPYGKSCLLWNWGYLHFFVWYRILFKYIMFDSKCPKCHSRFFSFFSNISCINHLTKSFLSSFSKKNLIVPILTNIII